MADMSNSNIDELVMEAWESLDNPDWHKDLKQAIQQLLIKERVYALEGVLKLNDGRTYSENTDWQQEVNRIYAIVSKRLEDTQADLQSQLTAIKGEDNE